MNCIQFEQHVHDLALDTLDEAALDEALAHADACADCARLLAESRALRAGLRALSENCPRQAPPRLEAMLLAAFRRERRAGAIRIRRRRWAWVGVAAAAALLLGAGAREWRQRSQTSQASRVPPPSSSTGEAVQANPAAVATAAASAEAHGPGPQAWPRRSGPAKSPGRLRKHGTAPERPKPQRRSQPRTGEIEWATDFLPLPYSGPYSGPYPGGVTSSDAGELVRIELSRAALADVGLTPADVAQETVTAEVFIGEDGTARAIRFAR